MLRSLLLKVSGLCCCVVSLVNPLSPDIKMHILLTVLQTFLMEKVRRICLSIKTSDPW